MYNNLRQLMTNVKFFHRPCTFYGYFAPSSQTFWFLLCAEITLDSHLDSAQELLCIVDRYLCLERGRHRSVYPPRGSQRPRRCKLRVRPHTWRDPVCCLPLPPPPFPLLCHPVERFRHIHCCLPDSQADVSKQLPPFSKKESFPPTRRIFHL